MQPCRAAWALRVCKSPATSPVAVSRARMPVPELTPRRTCKADGQPSLACVWRWGRSVRCAACDRAACAAPAPAHCAPAALERVAQGRPAATRAFSDPCVCRARAGSVRPLERRQIRGAGSRYARRTAPGEDTAQQAAAERKGCSLNDWGARSTTSCARVRTHKPVDSLLCSQALIVVLLHRKRSALPDPLPHSSRV